MLEINVPDEIFGGLNINAQQKEKFVLEAVKEKVERENKKKLTALLIEGYQATYDEDLAITKEFEAVDFESL